jgi:DNA repair protein SbcC/Rad50
MISFIELENFKSHANTRLEFSKGTNVLVGLAGSGKSSIFDALCFALYGTYPALSTRRVTLEETIKNKPNKMETTIVRLGFEVNQKEYVVERIINRKSTNQAKLKENGKLVAGPKPTEVTEKISKLTEVGYDLFCRAVYSEQNNIDYFLNLNPRERKQKFDELLSIDRYEKVRETATIVSNRLKKTVAEKKVFLKEQEKNVDEKIIEELGKKIKEKEERFVILEKEIEQGRRELSEAKKVLDETEAKEKVFSEIKKTMVSISAKIERVEKEITELEKKCRGNVKEEIEEKRRKIQEIEERRKVLAEKKEFLISESAKIETMHEELEKSLESLEKIKTSCPVCRKPLEEDTKKEILEETKKEKELFFEKKKENAKKMKAVLEEERQVIENQKPVQKELEGFLVLEKEKERLGSLLKEKEKLKTQEKELECALKEIDFDEKRVKSVTEKFFSQKQRLSEKESEAKNTRELATEFKKRFEELCTIRKAVENLKKTISAGEKNTEKLSLFINALKDTQSQLRTVLIDAVNETMEQIWPLVYPYRDFTSAKIDVINGNYEVFVKNNEGENIRVDGILSGGERTAVAITVRVAFSLVLTRNLGWIILDEPTHNLDRACIQELALMLKEHLPKIIEQAFIITHDREMEKAATEKSYFFERNKEMFEATNVSEVRSGF